MVLETLSCSHLIEISTSNSQVLIIFSYIKKAILTIIVIYSYIVVVIFSVCVAHTMCM